MNLFNRVLIIFIALGAMAFSMLVCLQLLDIISFEMIGMSLPRMERLLSYDGSDLKTRLISLGSLLGVFFLFAIILYLELSQFFSKERYFLVAKESLGMIEISEHCITRFINYEAKQFNSIDESLSSIKEKSDGFHVKSFITIKPETSINDLGNDFQVKIKTAMQEKLGLYVSEVTVKTRPSPAQKKTAHFMNRKGQGNLN